MLHRTTPTEGTFLNSIGLAAALLCGSAIGLVLVGLYPAGLDPVYGIIILSLAFATLLPFLLARGSKRAVWICLLTAFVLAGCGRALLIHPPVTPDDLAYYDAPPIKPSVRVIGVVSAEPVFSDRSQRLRISARSICTGEACLARTGATSPFQVKGDMYAVVARYPEFGVGEVLSLSGHLTPPPKLSGFDYAAYLARQGVFSYMSFPKISTLGRSSDTGLVSYIADQRSAARRILQSVVAEPEASIAVGVVTGDRTSMSDQIKANFRRSGTTHILAISGENIALLVGTVWLFYGGGKVKRRMPVWLALLVILLVIAYTIFTGASPSVVRAAFMGTLLLLGPVLGR